MFKTIVAKILNYFFELVIPHFTGFCFCGDFWLNKETGLVSRLKVVTKGVSSSKILILNSVSSFDK